MKMDTDEQEILEIFRKMTPQNRRNSLDDFRLIFSTQENTRIELEKEMLERKTA